MNFSANLSDYCSLVLLLLTEKELAIYGLKNFEGEYYYQNGKLHYGRTGKEEYDPFYQNRNAESIIRQLFANYAKNSLCYRE